MILSSWFKFTWRKFVLIIEFLMEDSLTAINWQRTFYFLAPYLICFYGIHDWNVDINIENVKKDHRRHIADQFNFHPKENIVLLIKIYLRKNHNILYPITKWCHFCLSISFMETHIIYYIAVLKIVNWQCVRKLL